MEQNYSNAQGYGIFCGKKCVEKKKAACIPPKSGKNKGVLPIECQRAQEAANSPKKSKAPIIIAAVVGVALIATVIIIARRKK